MVHRHLEDMPADVCVERQNVDWQTIVYTVSVVNTALTSGLQETCEIVYSVCSHCPCTVHCICISCPQWTADKWRDSSPILDAMTTSQLQPKYIIIISRWM